MQKQHTLSGPASLAGVSLHTGEKVTLTIHPAPVDHGFKFRRTDLKDRPTVDALASNVRTVERATTLIEGNVKVHTVEHILSALTGLGVDNALIEMDANEPPIGDGSAAPYVELIKKAGISEQDAPRRYCEIREPVAVQSKNGSILVILPDTKFRISCTQAGPDGNHTQYLDLEITPEVYEKEIAPARTFVHYEDVEPLMEKGLIRGGSLENAIVIRGESVLSKEPLRFPDEFVRHKILDIIGDLSLVGRPILGHVVAVRPGHGPNTELASAIAKEHAKMMAMIPPARLPVGERVLATTEIMKILPHRYPFLMVDRIVAFEGDTKCTGVKSVTINEPFFQGHFPGHPVMPGVLQVEAMAQVASILMMLNTQNSGKIGYFMSADEVKFRKPVFPGDTLFIHCELTRSRKTMARAACSCTVNGEIVSEGILLFGLVSE
jgi:UDP-3-O-[3-hydroxymyristoyl] N-acetylglucosamine deacetylase / 3-hydroxyacyl-[acyl-carrier-protein] dehydratase